MKDYSKRFRILLLGTFLYSLGIVLIIKANIGFAAWEVFHWGFGKTIGWSIGTASILVSIVICAIVVLMGEKLGLGTIVNMILMGVFIDVLLWTNLIPELDGIVFRILMLISGLFTIAFGSYFYINSGFGAGPRDSLMVAIERKTKLYIGLCRGIIEVSVTFIGWILGGPVGIGTVIAAVGIGLCVQIVFHLMKFQATSVNHETLTMTRNNLKMILSNKNFRKF